MEKFFTALTRGMKRNAGHYAAYVAALYFVEILTLMFSLLFIYGKLFSVVTGAVLSLALTAHIFSLAYRVRASRIIQLVIVDIHAPYSLIVCIVIAAAGLSGPLAVAALAYRAAVLVAEVPLVFVLTDKDVAASFGKTQGSVTSL